MLQNIRDRSQSWLAWIILGLISIPFAFWGMDSYFQNSDNDIVVAEVEGTEISLATYRTVMKQQQNRMRQILGAQFDPEMFDRAEIKQAVLENLIQDQVEARAARAWGFQISDELLRQTIADIPELQRNGRFDNDLYRRVLAQQGMTEAQFEVNLRRDMAQQLMRSSLQSSAVIGERMLADAVALRDEVRRARSSRISAAAWKDEVKPSDAQIQDAYTAAAARFQEPEEVRVAWIEASLGALAKEESVSEEELRALYDSRVQAFQANEQRRARHILLTVDAGADEATWQAAEQQLNGWRMQVTAGADFAALAKEHSQDPGSAAEGGDLGFFERGVMVPAFDQAVFSLQPSEVSQPIRTEFGMHLIQLVEVRADEPPSFADERPALLKEMQRIQAEERFYDLVDRLANAAYEHPDGLTVAAELTGLSVQESGWFTAQGGEGMMRHPQIVQRAFSDEVMRQGRNSGLIELEPDHVLVLRVLEHKPARQQALAEVLDDVVALVKQRLQAEAAKEAAEAQLEALRSDQALFTVCCAWSDAKDYQRNAAEDRELVAGLFAMNAEQERYARVALRNGDQLLVALEQVTPGTLEALDAQARTQLELALRTARAEEWASDALADFRAGLAIETFPQRLN
jgi:peptidyl-prolyl cis-trans isomerase D